MVYVDWRNFAFMNFVRLLMLIAFCPTEVIDGNGRVLCHCHPPQDMPPTNVAGFITENRTRTYVECV